MASTNDQTEQPVDEQRPQEPDRGLTQAVLGGAPQCTSEYAQCPEHDRRCIQAADHVARSPLHYNRAGFAWSDDEARAVANKPTQPFPRLAAP